MEDQRQKYRCRVHSHETLEEGAVVFVKLYFQPYREIMEGGREFDCDFDKVQDLRIWLTDGKGKTSDKQVKMIKKRLASVGYSGDIGDLPQADLSGNEFLAVGDLSGPYPKWDVYLGGAKPCNPGKLAKLALQFGEEPRFREETSFRDEVEAAKDVF